MKRKFEGRSAFADNPTEPLSGHRASQTGADTIDGEVISTTYHDSVPSDTAKQPLDSNITYTSKFKKLRFRRKPSTPVQLTTPDDYHNRKTDETFTIVESLFRSDDNYIQFFDRDVANHDALTRTKFTSKDLANLPVDNDPLLQNLASARAAYDELASQKVGWLSEGDGEARRAAKRGLKQRRATARAAFKTARETYITSQEATTLSTLGHLTLARSNYAERTYEARTTKFYQFGKKRRNAELLEQAEEYYYESRRNYRDELIADHDQLLQTDELRDQFNRSFDDHERGALAADEAHHYINEVTDIDKKSLLEKSFDSYNNLPTHQKIAAGMGIAALCATGWGTIGAATAVGGMISTRFAKGYFIANANHHARKNTLLAIQKRSTLGTGSYRDSAERAQQEWRTVKNPFKRSLLDSQNVAKFYADRDIQLNQDRRHRAIEKVRAIGQVGAMTAIFAAGGAVAEHILPSLLEYNGLFRADHHSGGHAHSPTHQPNTAPKPDQPMAAPTTQPEQPAPQTPASPEIPSASNSELVQLYGDYGGHEVFIKVPEGSSVWDRLNETTLEHNPTMPTAERERITANVVKQIFKQHPGFNPRGVMPGDIITVDLGI